MILRRIRVKNFGPFYHSTVIDFDKEVTVITGPNDTGKSSILQLINLLCTSRVVSEDQVNVDHFHDAKVGWQDDTDISVLATFEVSKLSINYLDITNVSPPLAEGDEVDLEYCLAPNKAAVKIVGGRRSGTSMRPGANGVRKFPTVLYLPNSEEIRPVINFNNPSGIEKKFLTQAFGENFAAKLSGVNDVTFTRELRAASRRMTQSFREILPASYNFDVVIDRLAGQSEIRLTVALRDIHESDTPLNLRGAGVRKMLNLLVLLMDRNVNDDQVVILIDEPENSLHPDAQHVFRFFLEQLAQKENIQVIYSTHSPSMINPLYGDRVRLVTRGKIDNVTSSSVNNHPYEHDFSPIRSSLGMTPADGLIYGPITIVAEGSTEVKTLRILLNRMWREKFGNYQVLERIIPNLFILDGQGDSFSYWCSLLKQQGNIPILVVDGDKVNRVANERKTGKLEGVPVVIIDGNREIEDLVPKDLYMDALKAETGCEELSLERLEEWGQKKNISPQMLFSKRVYFWLKETYPNIYYDKPGVMSLVVNSIDLTKVDLAPIEQLIQNVIQILGQT